MKIWNAWKGYLYRRLFNQTDDNIYKSKVIKDIDSNIGQLLKTDAKFYAIHVSPSEKELQAMGSTEQEQAEAMKRYIREVFIPEYAKNFNKGLSEADIKFYGKIHFDRNGSDNELNMHCHLIVSRKDQANKKKLSPLTNHKNTKNGIIKGGFDRVNLFQQIEQGFDKLFGHDRQQSESFDYHNTMKNGPILEQLKLQEQELRSNERETEIYQDDNIENLFSIIPENKETNNSSFNTEYYTDKHTNNHISFHPSSNQENKFSHCSLISFVQSKVDLPPNPNIVQGKTPKKKRKKRL